MFRHYDTFYSKTPMSGTMNFPGSSTLSATAVGLGFLKQPLRYLTKDDLNNIGNRTMQFPRPPTGAENFATPQRRNLGTAASNKSKQLH